MTLIRADLLDLKIDIEAVRIQINALQDKERMLIRSCPHDIQGDGAGGAQCVVCGMSFGWFCPTAPNKHCEYKDDPDSCIYCGQPEERK